MKRLLKLGAVALLAFAVQSSFAEDQLLEFDSSACKMLEDEVSNLPTKAEKFELLSSFYHIGIGVAFMPEEVSQEQRDNIKKLMVCIDQIAEKNDITGHRYPGGPNPYKAISGASALREREHRFEYEPTTEGPAPRCE